LAECADGRRALASALALLLVAPTAALADPPTLDTLYGLPVKDAAAVALGPGPETFVERSPWNSIPPNYVLNTTKLFGMSFFSRPVRIAPGVCAVTLGWVTFDTAPAPDASAEARASVEKLAYGQKPLRWLGFGRSRRYFAAGPAPAVPLKPGAKAESPPPEALAADSCDNPVSARKTFEASSPKAAASAVVLLRRAISSAQGRGRLAFRVRCGDDDEACTDARARLGMLKLQEITAIRTGPCPEADAAGAECLGLEVDDETLGRNEYWNVTITAGPAGKLRAVDLQAVIPPVV
jgi:hypothetical protein